MNPFQRRGLVAALGALGVAGTARASGFGDPDRPPQGAAHAAGFALPGAPGPADPTIAGQFPSFTAPPSTDIEGMPLFWASFNTAHARIQNGGWARQVTQADFAISEEIAGVNMRLAAGGIREMHWHQQAEWSIVTDGSIRITVLDELGRPQVADVGVGGLWYFPAGLPHSLQGLGPDGGEFVLAFDKGSASEDNTLLVTEWLAHVPPEVLAKNFGVPESAFAGIPLAQKWIFPGKVPGALAADQQAALATHGTVSPHDFTFDLGSLAPVQKHAGGSVRIADGTNFKVSQTIAAAMVTVAPGGMRELHWHPNADEWQYYVSGQARMTVFNTGPKAMTADFHPGDVGYVKKSFGHYIENTGGTDLVFFEIFRASRYMEVSLTDWLVHTPPAMVAQTLNLDAATVARFPRGIPDVVPV